MNRVMPSWDDSRGYRGALSKGSGNLGYTVPYTGTLLPSSWQGGLSGNSDTMPIAQQLANAKAATDQYQKWVGYNQAKDDASDPWAKLALGLNLAGLSAGAGAVIGPAVAGTVGTAGAAGSGVAGITGSALAGGVAGGAAAGATSGALGSLLTGQNPGKAALIGGVAGGLGGAAQPAVGGLSNATGLPTWASSGLVRGAVGSGVGALGGALTGGNPANGALTGGLSGIASGLVGNLTGNQALAGIGGTIGAGLAGKYLTGSSAPRQPVAAAPTPTASAPAVTRTPAVVPSYPQAAPTAATGAAPANIGAYSGFNSTGLGYQPMTQTNYANNTNWNNYGQGPQQSFFQPTPGT